MRLTLIAALILASSCAVRHLPSTPSFLVIPATAYSCTGPTERYWDQCRYTVEDKGSMHIRRIEFPKVK